MTDINKYNQAVAKQIEEFMAQIPSRELKRYATTQALLAEWLKLDGQATWLGQCLKSRFGGGDGNPALRAFQAGELPEFGYEFTMSLVDCCESLFNLVQSGWEYIEQELSQVLEDCPKNELELYQRILQEQYDNSFKDCLKQQKTTVSDLEESTKLAKKAIGDSKISPTVTVEPKLQTLLNQYQGNFWYSLSVGICSDKAKFDRPLNRLLTEHRNKSGVVYILLEQAARHARKSSDYSQLRSVRWEDGELYEGTKGGWNLVFHKT